MNHIALETSDIFALAKFLEQQGTEVTEVTGHYYDDLAPRFGLFAELITQLRTHHILYDEDEYGYFYQLYTHLFEKRFCFEFVQRVGYRGYGALNAQIRLMMQARELEQI